MYGSTSTSQILFWQASDSHFQAWLGTWGLSSPTSSLSAQTQRQSLMCPVQVRLGGKTRTQIYWPPRSIIPMIASLLLRLQKKLLSTSEQANEVEEGREEQKGKATPLTGAFTSFQRAFRKETELTTMSVGQAASWSKRIQQTTEE